MQLVAYLEDFVLNAKTFAIAISSARKHTNHLP
jgi:hypothetical protein